MSALNLSKNDLNGLSAFRETDTYQALAPQERGVLDRYWGLQNSGTLNGRSASVISGITDETAIFGGTGSVSALEAITEENRVVPEYFLSERPYLFFADPDTSRFYFFKNTNISERWSVNVEVLEMSTGKWMQVNNCEEFFGAEDKEYSGLIKANFIFIQFNKDITACDDIETYEKKESLEPKKRNEKYFCQVQTNGLCQIHAANAFLGYPAIKPSALIQFIALDGFEHQNIEGLAAGESPNPNDAGAAPSSISMGIDLGVVVQYMRHLDSDNELKVDISNMKVGRLSSQEGVLLFTNDATDEVFQVDETFLAEHSRAILGTYIPAHARALRKNTDGSWTNVDSMEVGQKIYQNIRENLIEILASQQANKAPLALPCAFA